jgi:hypothetical protein
MAIKSHLFIMILVIYGNMINGTNRSFEHVFVGILGPTDATTVNAKKHSKYPLNGGILKKKKTSPSNQPTPPFLVATKYLLGCQF